MRVMFQCYRIQNLMFIYANKYPCTWDFKMQSFILTVPVGSYICKCLKYVCACSTRGRKSMRQCLPNHLTYRATSTRRRWAYRCTIISPITHNLYDIVRNSSRMEPRGGASLVVGVKQNSETLDPKETHGALNKLLMYRNSPMWRRLANWTRVPCWEMIWPCMRRHTSCFDS